MRTQPPRYYFPKDFAGPWPAHLPPGQGHFALLEGKGPDPAGGGVCVGGPYQHAEGNWQQTSQGWWVHLANSRPQDTLRLHTIIGPLVALPGTTESYWHIPQLLEPDGTGGLISALDPVLSAAGWDTPAAYAEISAWLRATIDIADQLQAEDEQRLTDLAIALLAVNHHISAAEIIAGEWLTQSMLPAILRGACGLYAEKPAE